MENQSWEQYELHVVEHHQKSTGQTTWHQQVIPEDVYYASGYINNWQRNEYVSNHQRNRTLIATTICEEGLQETIVVDKKRPR